MSEPGKGSRRNEPTCNRKGRSAPIKEGKLAAPAGGGTAADEVAAAFQESFRTLWLVAMGFVRDATLADDIVQQAAVVALGKLGDFQPGTNAGGWLAGIVRNIAQNRARYEQPRRTSLLDPKVLEHTTSPAPEGPALPVGSGGNINPFRAVPADQPHFDDTLVAALNRLDDMARTCLLLRTLEEMPYARIAELLDLPEGTVMSHVHRARQFLRECLSGGPDSRDLPERRHKT